MESESQDGKEKLDGKREIINFKRLKIGVNNNSIIILITNLTKSSTTHEEQNHTIIEKQ